MKMLASTKPPISACQPLIRDDASQNGAANTRVSDQRHDRDEDQQADAEVRRVEVQR